MEDKILTQHPQGKKGVRIDRQKYERLAEYIINSLRKHEVLTFSQLSDRAEKDLGDTFDGSVLWYLVSVKLDLEARQIIYRVPKTSPQQLRLSE